ncbi:hypothetical protein T12_13622 [Trichinella patagoniensis]|uniref:Uncharacterized protein n=1 Tax=Trichinella patagoniensis TaxID=990121 RepID=A0A0V0YZ43_9BILA|nr:hypothetical protein T12_13622 [Trichinella patagoniensis]
MVIYGLIREFLQSLIGHNLILVEKLPLKLATNQFSVIFSPFRLIVESCYKTS